jgi:N-methylhydantoinase A
MADLVRKATIERGYDPREFLLVAYGGAGPLHASMYGRDIGTSSLLVPLVATVYSAFGAAASDIRHTFKRSAPHPLPGDPVVVAAHYSSLEAQAKALLHQEDMADTAIELVRWAEIRYRRQMHHVRVLVPEGPLDGATLSRVADAFETKYEALYGAGTAYQEAGAEIVTLGLDAIGRIAKPRISRQAIGAADPMAALKGSRPVYWPGQGFLQTTIYDAGLMRPGHRFVGPALIEMTGTTVAIPPEDTAEIDGFSNVMIRFGDKNA